MITIMVISAFERFLAMAPRKLSLERDDRLFRRDERVRELFLVIDGELCLERSAVGGAALILSRVGSGAVLAEASLQSVRYHCDARAATPCKLRALPVETARVALHEEPGLAVQWAAQLARELQRCRGRAELLRLRRVGDRLDAWCALTDSPLPEPGQGRRVADELGVTPEALYRELARRRVRA